MNIITVQELKKELDELLVENIVIIDADGKSPYFDTLVVCDCGNETAVQANANNLIQFCRKNDYAIRITDIKNPRWIVIDFYDIILHIFHEDERAIYNVESLWESGDIILVKDDE